jgi:hypothetical protein
VIVNDTSEDKIGPVIPIGFSTPHAMYPYSTRGAKKNSGEMLPLQIGLNVETKLPYHDARFAEPWEAPPPYSMQ